MGRICDSQVGIWFVRPGDVGWFEVSALAQDIITGLCDAVWGNSDVVIFH